jgi:3-methyladenine DNA glycosylase AlkD
MTPTQLAALATERLAAAADPVKAPQMAAYMKTDMPFYGVQKPARRVIERELKKAFRPATRAEYHQAIELLWEKPHREEKYTALFIGRSYKAYIDWESMPLYERLVRDGAWWDFVDEIATRLVGQVGLADPDRVRPLMDEWIEDDDMWIRRVAIIFQLKHKDATDVGRLERYCLERAHETEFFIRKAIGWSLREYSKTDPGWVREFLLRHRDRLSGLSFREGAKQLRRTGLLD